VKDVDVTRSTVQKAVVVLASTPIFGLIRYGAGAGNGGAQPQYMQYMLQWF
jgi:hypothetical protein